MLTYHLSKEESLILKGVAILMMLFLHLFNNSETAKFLNNLLFVDGIPLTNYITRACNPVSFYLILSGYGLYVTKSSFFHNLKRILSLYIFYWLTLLIFVPIGGFIVGIDKYPGSSIKILENVTGWNTSYNGEIWFLLPYALISLSSPILIKLFERFSIWTTMSISFLLNMVCGFLISRFGPVFLYSHLAPYLPIKYLSFIFPFIVGAWIAKYNVLGQTRFNFNNLYCQFFVFCGFLLLVILLRCVINTSAINTVYAVLFIIIFQNIPRLNIANHLFLHLGRQSTPMWFIHTYFAYYYFHNFIYSFHYPILIFLCLISCSYLCSLPLSCLNNIIQKFIFSRS